MAVKLRKGAKSGMIRGRHPLVERRIDQLLIDSLYTKQISLVRKILAWSNEQNGMKGVEK